MGLRQKSDAAQLTLRQGESAQRTRIRARFDDMRVEPGHSRSSDEDLPEGTVPIQRRAAEENRLGAVLSRQLSCEQRNVLADQATQRVSHIGWLRFFDRLELAEAGRIEFRGQGRGIGRVNISHQQIYSSAISPLSQFHDLPKRVDSEQELSESDQGTPTETGSSDPFGPSASPHQQDRGSGSEAHHQVLFRDRKPLASSQQARSGRPSVEFIDDQDLSSGFGGDLARSTTCCDDFFDVPTGQSAVNTRQIRRVERCNSEGLWVWNAADLAKSRTRIDSSPRSSNRSGQGHSTIRHSRTRLAPKTTPPTLSTPIRNPYVS